MVRKKKKVASCLALLISMFMLTGCWDNHDVTELNLLTAVGFDKTPDGRIEHTAEIPKPSLARAGQEQGGGGGDEKAVTIVSSQGDTAFVAGRSTVERLAKRFFPSTNELVLVSESIAQEGLLEVLDFLERDPEANLTALMLLAKGAPIKAIMEAKSEQERIPSQHIVKSITANQNAFGSSKEARVIDVLREISNSGIDPLIPVIEIHEDKEPLKVKDMHISGSAAFRGDRLAGYLDAIETRGWLLVENKAEMSVFSVPSPFSKDKYITFEMFRSHCKKEVEFIDGKPKLVINLKVSGNIGQSEDIIDLTQPETKGIFEKEAAKIIRKEIEGTLIKAQEYQSDIFGFGDHLHKRHLDKWKELQKDWEETFSKAPYEIEVEVKVKRSGYFRKSIEPK